MQYNFVKFLNTDSGYINSFPKTNKKVLKN